MQQQITLLLIFLGMAYCLPQFGTIYVPSNPNPGRVYYGKYPSQETVTLNPYQGSKSAIPILRFDSKNNLDGSYSFAYESGNGITAHEDGVQKVVGEGAGTVASGGYSYTGPDGQQYSITYTADENGFRPVGAHIPTPPPIPEAILRALQLNAAEEARGGYQKGDRGQYQSNYKF